MPFGVAPSLNSESLTGMGTVRERIHEQSLLLLPAHFSLPSTSCVRRGRRRETR